MNNGADGTVTNVGAIAGFLEGQASLHFTFGLVEMAIFRFPDGAQLVQPRVLAQSAIVKRIVVDLRADSMSARELGPEESDGTGIDLPDPDVAARRQRYQKFWKDFLQEVRLDDRSQEMRPPATSTNQYFVFPKDTAAWVSAYLYQSAGQAGVYLTFYKGPIGDRLYKGLEADRMGVEHALDVPVEWDSDGQKHIISTYRKYTGSLLDDHALEIQKDMADWVNRYVNVFRPRLEKLARETT